MVEIDIWPIFGPSALTAQATPSARNFCHPQILLFLKSSPATFIFFDDGVAQKTIFLLLKVHFFYKKTPQHL
jgi:hypothetical protein